MTGKIYKINGVINIFQVENPWVYVAVPKKITEETKQYADRGLVAISAKIGKSTWNTSLMPMGDGTQFIPLPAKTRKAEKINVGDTITITFILRERKRD